MNDIEVGDFIRTKTGKIVKIDKIDLCNICEKKEYVNIEIIKGLEFENTYHKEDIINYSKNIIDLIEVGDYVNLERVLDITGEYIRTTERIHNKNWLSNNINSIVTKEQFQAIEYKIGG